MTTTTTTTTTTTNSQVINKYGGNGGSEFASDYIMSLAIRTGARVDAIIINDKRYGGTGGSESQTLIFNSEEFISEISIHSGSRVDNLQFTTNMGRKIGGGGTGGSEKTILTGIRVIAIGGRAGKNLDQIKITYVENYKPSSLIEKRGQFIIGFTAEGTTLKEYEEQSSKSYDSYENVTETMISQQYNASVEAEYYAKVSFSTEIKYENTQLTTIKTELEEQLLSSLSTEVTIREGMVGILLVDGTIMEGDDPIGENADNPIWMYPISVLSYAVISVDNYKSVLEHYDLTGELAVVMPELIDYKTEKNGYVFYENK